MTEFVLFFDVLI